MQCYWLGNRRMPPTVPNWRLGGRQTGSQTEPIRTGQLVFILLCYPMDWIDQIIFWSSCALQNEEKTRQLSCGNAQNMFQSSLLYMYWVNYCLTWDHTQTVFIRWHEITGSQPWNHRQEMVFEKKFASFKQIAGLWRHSQAKPWISQVCARQRWLTQKIRRAF